MRKIRKTGNEHSTEGRQVKEFLSERACGQTGKSPNEARVEDNFLCRVKFCFHV